MKKLFFFVATVCTILSSCSKGDDSNNDQTNKVFVVKAIARCDYNANSDRYYGDATGVTYDAKGRVINYGNYSFTYNGKSVIIKDETEENTVMYATLNDNGYITEAQRYETYNEREYKYEYQVIYNKSGRLTEMHIQEYVIKNNITFSVKEDDFYYEWENNNPVQVKWTERDLRDGSTSTDNYSYTYRTEKNNINIYPFTSCSIFANMLNSMIDEIACMFGLFGKFPTNLTKYENSHGSSYDYIFNDDGSISQAMTSTGGNYYWTERYWY